MSFPYESIDIFSKKVLSIGIRIAKSYGIPDRYLDDAAQEFALAAHQAVEKEPHCEQSSYIQAGLNAMRSFKRTYCEEEDVIPLSIEYEDSEEEEESHYPTAEECAEDPLYILMDRERDSALESAFRSLPAMYRKLLQSVYVKRVTLQEMARSLRISISKVRYHLEKARSILRSSIEDR